MDILKIAHCHSCNKVGHLVSQDIFVCVCVPSPPTWFETVSLLFTAVFARLSGCSHLLFPQKAVLGLDTHALLCPAFSMHSADLNASCRFMQQGLHLLRHLSSLVDHRIFDLEQLC